MSPFPFAFVFVFAYPFPSQLIFTPPSFYFSPRFSSSSPSPRIISPRIISSPGFSNSHLIVEKDIIIVIIQYLHGSACDDDNNNASDLIDP